MKQMNPKQNLFDTFQGVGNTYTINYKVQFSLIGSIYKNGVRQRINAQTEPIVCTPRDVIKIVAPRGLTVVTTQRNGRIHADNYTGVNVESRSEITSLTISTTAGVNDDTEITFTVSNTYNGLFQRIKSLYSTDFTIPISYLDETYLTNHSPNKIPSATLAFYALTYGEELTLDMGDRIQTITDKGLTELAKMIWGRCGETWVRMYNALILEYEPLENYNSIEIESPDIAKQFKVSDDYKTTDTEKRDTSVTTTNNNNTNTGSVKAFNSSAFTDVNKTTLAGSVTVAGDADDNVTVVDHEQTGYTEETEKGSRTTLRHGNIGVTTSQQMLQSEVDLRTKTRIWDIMMKDVDDLLTAPAYRVGLTNIWL